MSWRKLERSRLKLKLTNEISELQIKIKELQREKDMKENEILGLCRYGNENQYIFDIEDQTEINKLLKFQIVKSDR